jgi:aspartyl-tRNA(Asn)/glutamyl-tRNA(Gln) amidotransferase subunit A
MAGEGMKGLPEHPYLLTIAQAARLIRTRELSPVELAESVLSRIDETEGKVQAYVAVFGDRVLDQAKEAEKDVGQGRWRGPLHGIPIALKDVFLTAGGPTEAGSKVLKGYIPTSSSTVEARLAENGATIIGKTVTTEFAYYAWPAHIPRTRNPWNLAYEPGDSSAGSGPVVAADSAMGAMGTDAGGSIRKPAAYCGVVGLKPTFGLISRHGVISMSKTLDHCGPISKTVEDASIIMTAICGHDHNDSTSLDTPIPDFTSGLDRGIDGLRIGVEYDHFLSAQVTEPVRRSMEGARSVLEGLGATLVPVRIPLIAEAISAGGIILSADASFFHQKWLREMPDQYEPDTRLRLELGELILATDYLQALHIRRQFKQAMRQVFDDNNLSALITPTSPATADRLPLTDAEKGDRSGLPARLSWNQMCSPFNLTGQPALSVPCGFSDAGLPIGLQIVGRPMEDQCILRIGFAYEQATDWHKRTPPI